VKKGRFLKFVPFAVSVLCAVVIFLTLYTPEAVGVANNGDFVRIMRPNRISFTENGPQVGKCYAASYIMDFHNGSYVQKIAYFLQTDYSWYDFFTSQHIFIKLSKILNLANNYLSGAPHNGYNLFWLFLIYVIVYAYSFYLILNFILRRFGRKWFIYAAAVALIVFCDQGYTLYFNSLYGEALQLVSTFLAIGLFLRLSEKRDIYSLILYFTAVIIMASSKNANIPAGVIFSLLPLSLLYDKRAVFQLYILAFSGTAVAMLLFLFNYLTPAWIERDTNFDSVFQGVLVGSKTPGQDLTELGLDPSYAILKGANAYKPSLPIDIKSDSFKTNFYGNISKTKIVLFYAKHPERFLSAMEYSANYAKYIRAPYLTNMQNPKARAEQSYRYSLWEGVRVRSGVNNLWVTVILLVSALYLCIRLLRANLQRGGAIYGIELPFLMMAVAASAAVNFVIPYISNGIGDIAKHMFGFICFYDMIIFFLIGMIFNILRKYAVKKHG